MTNFERTTDYDTVRSILTDKRCYVRMVNDFAPSVSQFEMLDMDRFSVILAREHGNPVAVFLIGDGHAPGIGEIHFCFVPGVWGRTTEIGRAFMGWTWANTSLHCLRGPIPSYNRLALELAEECGFEPYGIQGIAGTRNGKEYDLILTEARRP